MKTISPRDLRAELDTQPTPALLDVRLLADHLSARIPGSRSNCVFEVAFTSRLSDTAPDKARPIRVIGWNDASQEARMAVEKLERLGYADARALEGGIEAWIAQGFSIEPAEPGGPAEPAKNPPKMAALPDGRLSIPKPPSGSLRPT